MIGLVTPVGMPTVLLAESDGLVWLPPSSRTRLAAGLTWAFLRSLTGLPARLLLIVLAVTDMAPLSWSLSCSCRRVAEAVLDSAT